jgi:WD40 repeat protein
LYDASTFAPVLRLPMPVLPDVKPDIVRTVEALAVSNDGGRVAAAYSGSAMIMVFDVRAARPLKMLAGHKKVVTSVAFAGDGRTLVSASEDETARVWNVDAGAATRVVPCAGVPVVAMAPKGDAFALASWKRPISIVSVASGQPLRTMPAPKGQVMRLEVSADGKTLAAGGYETPHANTLIYDFASGRQIRAFATSGWPTFSPDGRWLAGSTEEDSQVYDLKTGAQLASFKTRRAPYFMRSGALLLFTHEGTIESTDPQGASRRVIAPAPRRAGTFVFGPGSRVAYLQDEKYLGVCDLAPALECREIPSAANALAYDPQGNWFVTVGAQTSDVDVFDAMFRPRKHVTGGEHWAPSAVAVTADGKKAFVGRNFVSVVDLELGVPVKTSLADRRQSGAPFLRPDGRELALLGYDGSVALIVEPTTGEPLRTLTLDQKAMPNHPAWHAAAFAWSPDGSLAALASYDVLGLFDANGRLLKSVRLPVRNEKGVVTGIRALAFDPRAPRLAVARPGTPAAEIFDVATLAPIASLANTTGYVYSLSFRRDGQVLATTTTDGMQLFSPTGAPLASLTILEGDGAFLRSPDGARAEVFGSASRWLGCEIGPWIFPFALCEDRVVTKGLVPPP